MHLEELTLALFAASNSMRIIAYVPQIHKAATERWAFLGSVALLTLPGWW